MASQITLAISFGLMAVLLLAVYGAVDRRERVAFCLGILLVGLGLTLGSAGAGMAVATLGLAGVVGSAVTLLR